MNPLRDAAAEARRSREDVLKALRDDALPRQAREALHRMERGYARLARTADKLADDAELLARLVQNGSTA
jgi:hypothetical protein